MASKTWSVAIFGATGFAGNGVLRACLADPRVGRAVVIARRPLQTKDPKLTVVVHEDFLDLGPVAKHLAGLDAVYYCLGVSQSDMKDPAEYRRITYDYTLVAAQAIQRQSPKAVFHFLSGAGTKVDGRWMWARVKGEAERDLREAGLGGVVCYRPALIVGERGEKSRYKVEAVFRPLQFLYRPMKGLSLRTIELGQAMLQATHEGLRESVLENKDLRRLATKYKEPPVKTVP